MCLLSYQYKHCLDVMYRKYEPLMTALLYTYSTIIQLAKIFGLNEVIQFYQLMMNSN